ncbi:MAG: DUF6483 family protein [Bacillota bacterium]|nr:DUF6483 family protein [Bacillota bacterium]
MVKDEYIIRLVKGGAQMAVALLAGKDAVKSDIDIENYNMTLSEEEVLEFVIRKYISEGKINEAENTLFQALEARKNKKNLETALFFYEELSKWEEAKLLKCNFSKSEIEQGLKDIKELYEID